VTDICKPHACYNNGCGADGSLAAHAVWAAAVSRDPKELRLKWRMQVSAKAQERVMKSCTRQCAYECAKPGKAYDFVVPYRQ
jgi:hypothetical protein